jgi:hypothetical protein
VSVHSHDEQLVFQFLLLPETATTNSKMCDSCSQEWFCVVRYSSSSSFTLFGIFMYRLYFILVETICYVWNGGRHNNATVEQSGSRFLDRRKLGVV